MFYLSQADSLGGRALVLGWWPWPSPWATRRPSRSSRYRWAGRWWTCAVRAPTFLVVLQKQGKILIFLCKWMDTNPSAAAASSEPHLLEGAWQAFPKTKWCHATLSPQGVWWDPAALWPGKAKNGSCCPQGHLCEACVKVCFLPGFWLTGWQPQPRWRRSRSSVG